MVVEDDEMKIIPEGQPLIIISEYNSGTDKCP